MTAAHANADDGADLMEVSLRLPTRLLFAGKARSLYASGENGAFGLLPRHADFVTSLLPSVLVLTDQHHHERFFGIDYGLLVKRGHAVEIVVRRGIEGDSLESLSARIESSFRAIDEEERAARTALSRLEIGIVRHLSQLQGPKP